MGGGVTPCHDATGSWYVLTLLPEAPGTRVRYPFKYSTGTRVQKYPKVRALVR